MSVVYIITDGNSGTDSTIYIVDTIFQENDGVVLGVENLQTEQTKTIDLTLKNVLVQNSIVSLSTGIVQVDGRVNLNMRTHAYLKVIKELQFRHSQPQ